MSAYIDYRLRASSLDQVRAALAALRAAGIVGADEGPENMLGDPQTDDAGRIVFRASRGRDARVMLDEDGRQIAIPARGRADRWYIAIRSTVPPQAVPIDPTAFGLEWCVWA
jgi:hypothetical protein